MSSREARRGKRQKFNDFGVYLSASLAHLSARVATLETERRNTRETIDNFRRELISLGQNLERAKVNICLFQRIRFQVMLTISTIIASRCKCASRIDGLVSDRLARQPNSSGGGNRAPDSSCNDRLSWYEPVVAANHLHLGIPGRTIRDLSGFQRILPTGPQSKTAGVDVCRYYGYIMGRYESSVELLYRIN